jgi:hypothetical protein
MPSVVARDAMSATVIAILMSNIIPGRRVFSSPHAPVRNGAPPYRKIRVPSTGDIQSAPTRSGTV